MVMMVVVTQVMVGMIVTIGDWVVLSVVVVVAMVGVHIQYRPIEN